jgi:hypothetical protein
MPEPTNPTTPPAQPPATGNGQRAATLAEIKAVSNDPAFVLNALESGITVDALKDTYIAHLQKAVTGLKSQLDAIDPGRAGVSQPIDIGPPGERSARGRSFSQLAGIEPETRQ